MTDILIESGVEIVITLLLTLIGVLGTWLSAKLAKKAELANINAAQQEVIEMAKQTVSELKQTIVDDLKAASADGKLTKDEIAQIGIKLHEKTQAKISAATQTILIAANVDISALIQGAAEDLIATWNVE